jgi:hypothetical protein
MISSHDIFLAAVNRLQVAFPAHAGRHLTALVVECRGVRAGRQGVRQALGQLIDPPAGLPVRSLDVAIEAAVGDDLDDVLDVIEDEK